MVWRRGLAVVALVTAGAGPVAAHALVGAAAPDFRFRQVVGEPGGRSLADLRGRAVFLFFFKCDDAACVEHTARVSDLHDRYLDRGLVVLGVSEDPVPEMGGYLGRNAGTFPCVLDDGFRTMAAFGAVQVPTAVLLSPAGRVVWSGTPKSMLDGVVEPWLKRAVPPSTYEWKGSLAPVGARVAAGDWGGALKSVERLADTVDADTRAAATAAITAQIDGLRGVAEAEAADGWYDVAIAMVSDLAARCRGTAPGDALKATLAKWKADSAVKAELKGNKLLAQAQACELQFAYAAAASVYQRVIKSMEGTKSADLAAVALKHIEEYGLAAVRRDCDDCRQRRTPCEAHGG